MDVWQTVMMFERLFEHAAALHARRHAHDGFPEFESNLTVDSERGRRERETPRRRETQFPTHLFCRLLLFPSFDFLLTRKAKVFHSTTLHIGKY